MRLTDSRHSIPTDLITGGPVILPMIIFAMIAGITGCSSDDGRTLDQPTEPLPVIVTTSTTGPAPAPLPPLKLVAPWLDGASIPVAHTCDGDDTSPALTFADVPPGAAELVVIVTDLDADGFIHWLLSGIDPAQPGLVEGEIPSGATEWNNSFGNLGWNGPCPPPGANHRYQFTVHALNQPLELADDAAATEAIAAINSTSIGQYSVSGVYLRLG